MELVVVSWAVYRIDNFVFFLPKKRFNAHFEMPDLLLLISDFILQLEDLLLRLGFHHSVLCSNKSGIVCSSLSMHSLYTARPVWVSLNLHRVNGLKWLARWQRGDSNLVVVHCGSTHSTGLVHSILDRKTRNQWLRLGYFAFVFAEALMLRTLLSVPFESLIVRVLNFATPGWDVLWGILVTKEAVPC